MAKPNDKNPTDAEQPEVVEWVDQPLLQTAFVTSDGRILKGIDAEDAPFGAQPVRLLCLHSVDIPLPSDDPKIIAQSCVRTVPHPILGTTKQFAVSMDVGLAMLEVAHALQKRDERIEAQDEKIAALERGLAEAAQALDEMAKNIQELVTLEPPRPSPGDGAKSPWPAELHQAAARLDAALNPKRLSPTELLTCLGRPGFADDLRLLAAAVGQDGVSALAGLGIDPDSRLGYLMGTEKHRKALDENIGAADGYAGLLAALEESPASEGATE